MKTLLLILALSGIAYGDYTADQLIYCEDWDNGECRRGRYIEVDLWDIAENWLECQRELVIIGGDYYYLLLGDTNNDGIVNFIDFARLTYEP